MKIKLNSDFRDFYDHWFCGEHEKHEAVLDRRSRNGVSKQAQFKILESLGVKTPLNGTVANISQIIKDKDVVLYIDPYAHSANGKVLVNLSDFDISVKYRNYWCSEFVQSTKLNNASVGYKLLFIGGRHFWIIMKSKDWRSNFNPFHIELHPDHPDGVSRIGSKFLDRYPIFSIDFIFSTIKYDYLAIDWNTAPGLKNIGIEEIMKPKEVYDLIETWMLTNG